MGLTPAFIAIFIHKPKHIMNLWPHFGLSFADDIVCA